ncbi:MAG: nicotinamide riboside transporter PnuC, partial [Micrococcaceae bacterium]|nr:nicotinamide riboside transporter PnuC [Micrococcaceae bacterium]
MESLRWLIDIFNANIPVGNSSLLVREVVGNI